MSVRQSTPAPHGVEYPPNLIQAVGSTLVYCYSCTNVGFVKSSTFPAPWTACKGAIVHDIFTENYRQLRLQWAHEHRARKADWHKVIFSDESRFNLWNNDGRVYVRHCAGQECGSRVRYHMT